MLRRLGTPRAAPQSQQLPRRSCLAPAVPRQAWGHQPRRAPKAVPTAPPKVVVSRRRNGDFGHIKNYVGMCCPKSGGFTSTKQHVSENSRKVLQHPLARSSFGGKPQQVFRKNVCFACTKHTFFSRPWKVRAPRGASRQGCEGDVFKSGRFAYTESPLLMENVIWRR